MYFNNLLAKPSGLVLNDIAINLADNNLPTYILAAKQDHIVLWEAAYEATKLYSGEIRFVLSASGHVAGVINHPSKNKYSFWTNDTVPGSADEWLHAAKENAGSWWTDWSQWQMQYSGKKIKSHKIPAKYIIEVAPGSYVKSKN